MSMCFQSRTMLGCIMKKTMIAVAVATVICAWVTAPVTARAAKKSKEIQEALEAKYQPTKVGWDQTRITQPGTILVVQKDGIYAETSNAFNMTTTKVVNGQVEPPKGFLAAMSASRKNRELKVGDTVYVEHMKVTDKYAWFELITCNTYDVNMNGSTRNIRYGANVVFEFPQGFIEKADAPAVEKEVEAVLIPQSEAQAAKTKTIGLGQTLDQVKSILGAPDRIVNLGPKQIYIYKDMKVIFENGKVSDVE